MRFCFCRACAPGSSTDGCRSTLSQYGCFPRAKLISLCWSPSSLRCSASASISIAFLISGCFVDNPDNSLTESTLLSEGLLHLHARTRICPVSLERLVSFRFLNIFEQIPCWTWCLCCEYEFRSQCAQFRWISQHKTYFLGSKLIELQLLSHTHQDFANYELPVRFFYLRDCTQCLSFRMSSSNGILGKGFFTQLRHVHPLFHYSETHVSMNLVSKCNVRRRYQHFALLLIPSWSIIHCPQE